MTNRTIRDIEEAVIACDKEDWVARCEVLRSTLIKDLDLDSLWGQRALIACQAALAMHCLLRDGGFDLAAFRADLNLGHTVLPSMAFKISQQAGRRVETLRQMAMALPEESIVALRKEGGLIPGMLVWSRDHEELPAAVKTYLDALPGFSWGLILVGKPQPELTQDQHGFATLGWSRGIAKMMGE